MKFKLLAAVLLPVIMLLPFTACTVKVTTTPSTSPVVTEVEAVQFSGVDLIPINLQGNNALAGTQYIDRAAYTLTVDGLVDHPLSLTYDQIAAYPQVSRLVTLDCVDGWNFTAKWTGPTLNSILKDAGVQAGVKILIFYTTDVPAGYTSLELSYIQFQDTIIALKLNDITLSPDRGFPFQVVADGKWGYKWAKWVTRIEVSDNTDFLGYWEKEGLENIADVAYGKF